MAYDEDFYEFATRFPRSALALAGIGVECAYRADSVEVKRVRRTDLVFQPSPPGAGPRVYLEFQARHDPEVERKLLEKVVLHSVKDELFDGVEAVILYTERRFLAPVLPADVGSPDGSLVRFTPRRVVLSDCSSAALEGQGPAAWIALPLVGSVREVRARAAEWHQRLRRTPELDELQRTAALEYFARFLASRLRKMDVSELLQEGERVMEGTVTGQRLIEKGIEQGVERTRREAVVRVLETRFGSVPGAIAAALGDLHDPEALDRLLTAALKVDSLAAFQERLAADAG